MTKSFDAQDYLARRARNEGRLGAAGVYSPDMEHDACGVGFVAARDGQPNRAVVESAIEALQAIWHRGAVDADGMTGDGAGIHIEIPRDFFIEHIARTGHDVGGWLLAWCFCRAQIWPPKSAVVALLKKKFWRLGILFMAGGRYLSIPARSAKKPSQLVQKLNKSCSRCQQI